ncbi:MAG: hypothetical protein H0W86_13925 [Armatimonadetes bacterium]|nr:hypothetical protein [Armatimonadota bacterium]
MKRFAALGGAVTIMGLAWETASADIVIVHIFDMDFSTNPMGEPIEDAVIDVGDTVQWVLDMCRHSTTSVSGIPEVWDAGIMGQTG